MVLLDVDVLAYAHRRDAPGHEAYRQWWEDCAGSEQAFGMADLVLSGFLSHRDASRIFNPPTPPDVALRFVQEVRARPNCVEVSPAPGTRTSS